MIAALFVDPNGCYAGLPGVDLWDEKRDARGYAGPYPVVAHPPCSRWCRLAGLVEARWGHKKGDDGGCFEAALRAVRTWGGVLEHPAWSDAWHEFRLPIPHRGGGWQHGLCGGASCYVEQWHYGHRAKKGTWLYAWGVELPGLRWGATPDSAVTAYVSSGGADKLGMRPQALVSWCGNHVAGSEVRPRLGRKEASATTPEFRDVLLGMARTANHALH